MRQFMLIAQPKPLGYNILSDLMSLMQLGFLASCAWAQLTIKKSLISFKYDSSISELKVGAILLMSDSFCTNEFATIFSGYCWERATTSYSLLPEAFVLSALMLLEI